MKRAVHLILISLTAITISACAGATATPSPTVAPTVEEPAIPSPTFSVTPTLPSSATPTASATARPSATPGPDFGEASILSVAHLEGNRLMVIIRVPDGVEGAYDAYIGATYLPCETPRQYPDRILCVGPEPYVNYSAEGALVQLYPLYPTPQAPPLFEAFISIPAQATPTATQPVWYPPIPDIPGFP